MAYPKQFRAPNRSAPAMSMRRYDVPNEGDNNSNQAPPNKQGYNAPSNNKNSTSATDHEVPLYVSRKENEKKANEFTALKDVENNLETYLSGANPSFITSTSKVESSYNPDNFNRHIPANPYNNSGLDYNSNLSRNDLLHKFNDLKAELVVLEKMLQIMPNDF